ncbi:HrcA family transcriptional regulator [Helicobacter cappadocius]|uniref:HrcA family transcriptional regulator n=1 Tax=Helicobacter cappadocius TaxID=3063998 RepID=A0AA90SS25_9HELI|nr:MULTISPECIES: HrcA family transcriptional regulator [unclassified Helicobacter]MDO7252592.1 HrcA family transcriptional regulator [Helicobacter sp. faydin-H75]MDP2538459.1 HrcA family transcriptional regulator [Helicobacter sp. faydin-H76]
MNHKKDLLLDGIIKRYVQFNEPIGSESLKMSMSIKISSATIRNYFKILSEEGILTQPHISSGRIPTNRALKGYWRANLQYKENILNVDIGKIQQACQKIGVFCVIREKTSQILKEVINYENRFLILAFENNEIAVPFNHSVERFLKELIGLEFEDIKKIASQVCATALLEKLNLVSNVALHKFGIEFLALLLRYQEFHKLFFEITDGHIFDRLPKGIYFENTVPEGSIGIVQDISIDKKEAQMFCMGELNKNYTYFYEEIAS